MNRPGTVGTISFLYPVSVTANAEQATSVHVVDTVQLPAGINGADEGVVTNSRHTIGNGLKLDVGRKVVREMEKADCCQCTSQRMTDQCDLGCAIGRDCFLHGSQNIGRGPEHTPCQ